MVECSLIFIHAKAKALHLLMPLSQHCWVTRGLGGTQLLMRWGYSWIIACPIKETMPRVPRKNQDSWFFLRHSCVLVISPSPSFHLHVVTRRGSGWDSRLLEKLCVYVLALKLTLNRLLADSAGVACFRGVCRLLVSPMWSDACWSSPQTVIHLRCMSLPAAAKCILLPGKSLHLLSDAYVPVYMCNTVECLSSFSYTCSEFLIWDNSFTFRSAADVITRTVEVLS